MTQNPSNPPRKILLGVDGSAHAYTATKLLANLPLPDGCQILAVSVILPRNAQYHSALKTVLEQTARILELKGRQVQTRLMTGSPAEEIIAAAKVEQPDLIVLGAKGLRATLGILLGGVAQQVVEYACCPVLVVRAPHQKVHKILLVTDGSEYSRLAIEHLACCPLPEGCEYHLLHVLPPLLTPDVLMRSWAVGLDVVPPAISPDMEATLRQQSQEEEQAGQELLERSWQQLQNLGLQAKSVLRHGDAATEILAYAQEQDIDLIIAGSRGLSQMRGWLLGSVSRKLVHYADCSVLIVKGEVG